MIVIVIAVPILLWMRMRMSMTMSILTCFIILIEFKLSWLSISNVFRLLIIGILILCLFLSECISLVSTWLLQYYFFLFWFWWFCLWGFLCFLAWCFKGCFGRSLFAQFFSWAVLDREVSRRAVDRIGIWWWLDELFAIGVSVATYSWRCHSSLNVFVVFLDLVCAWVSLLFWLNVQESFSLLLKLSEFSNLPPLRVKILLSPLISELLSFLFSLHLFLFFKVLVVFIHVPLF